MFLKCSKTTEKIVLGNTSAELNNDGKRIGARALIPKGCDPLRKYFVGPIVLVLYFSYINVIDV